MIGVFKHYFTHCLDGFSSIVITAAVLYALLAIIIGLFKGRRVACGLLLIGFCLLLLYLTVLSRHTGEYLKYCLLPLSSYTRIANGDKFLLPQVIMNVFTFVPVGFLLKGFFANWGWIKVLVYGALFSLAIEVLQLILLRGAAEVDDVIHNTLGCAIGVLVFKAGNKLRGLNFKNRAAKSKPMVIK